MHAAFRLTGACLLLALAACDRGPTAGAVSPASDASATAAFAAEPTPVEPRSAVSLAGHYVSTPPHAATLTLSSADGDDWNVQLQGGSNADDGAGAAADCEIRARGPAQDGRIEATLVPFDGELMSVTEADLARAGPATVHVVVDDAEARVDTRLPTALCALNTTFDGRYRREQ